MSTSREVSIEGREAAGCAVLAMAHGGLGEGVRGLLSTQFDSVVVVADEPSLKACLAALRPELLVLDAALVAGAGFGLATRLKRAHPELRILLLVADDDPAIATAAAASGAEGCLLTRLLGRDLMPAVDEILGGRRVFWSTGRGDVDQPVPEKSNGRRNGAR